MAITYYDKKYTPNQFAKELLIDAMELKKDFWVESINDDRIQISEKEIAQVHEQLRKRINGLLKYLGKNYYYPSNNKSEVK
jgi:hypothetical protein|tara:strand:- start:340 stop:582 length:243 start_codon:yes stop_codon:yes gene_type:complete